MLSKSRSQCRSSAHCAKPMSIIMLWCLMSPERKPAVFQWGPSEPPDDVHKYLHERFWWAVGHLFPHIFTYRLWRCSIPWTKLSRLFPRYLGTLNWPSGFSFVLFLCREIYLRHPSHSLHRLYSCIRIITFFPRLKIETNWLVAENT